MSSALDNPVWHALAALPDDLVVRRGHAARFVPEAAPFFAVDRPSPQAYADVGRILQASPEARFFQAADAPAPAGWRETFKKPILQMILPGELRLPPSSPDIRALRAADVPAMLDLAAQARPGPFGPRTPELGSYAGVFDGERLVAMAGERFRFPGYTEISAVATHPEFRGRGYGRTLTIALANRIRADGRTPFLHVFADNRSAGTLYGSIGFVARRDLFVVWLAPA
jgi:ribosomal protein S18 acetylase RimI-like enzyme